MWRRQLRRHATGTLGGRSRLERSTLAPGSRPKSQLVSCHSRLEMEKNLSRLDSLVIAQTPCQPRLYPAERQPTPERQQRRPHLKHTEFGLPFVSLRPTLLSLTPNGPPGQSLQSQGVSSD